MPLIFILNAVVECYYFEWKYNLLYKFSLNRDVAVPSKFTLLHNQGNSGVTVSSDYEVSTATPDTPPQSFLDWYTITCIEFMNPKVTGKRMPLCPCLPDTLGTFERIIMSNTVYLARLISALLVSRQ